MEAELAALASSAATVVVQQLATTGWEKVQTSLGTLWRRVYPDRAGTVEADLEETRAALIAARDAEDADAEQGLVVEWQSRLRRLLAADGSLAAELRRVLDEFEQPEPAAGDVITMNATASGGSRVIQGGRDVHVTGE
ncbi:hypothetical protein ACIBLA_35100 [Streptomyces sp. NPDC050433]|uniref:hypothetical protein n=1 Tax=Streptomyces sp. NPDC050433 TaxID=3365615 RepID=UPI0037B0F5E7